MSTFSREEEEKERESRESSYHQDVNEKVQSDGNPLLSWEIERRQKHEVRLTVGKPQSFFLVFFLLTTVVLPEIWVKQSRAVMEWWKTCRKVRGFFLSTRKTVSSSSTYLTR